ncbi:MAG: diacylglycerol kinase family protein [Chloroflexi bacterium]|nr:diacylglycerol kinase family protein [Chloroflexota bacterium]
MLSFLSSRANSFRNAFSGWWYVLRTQRNAWIHGIFSITAFISAYWVKLDTSEWALIILATALVWTAEFINTALEAVVDLHSPDQHPLAKVGKDVGAAGVLIAAGAAFLIGLLVLLPPLWEKLTLILTKLFGG